MPNLRQARRPIWMCWDVPVIEPQHRAGRSVYNCDGKVVTRGWYCLQRDTFRALGRANASYIVALEKRTREIVAHAASARNQDIVAASCFRRTLAILQLEFLLYRGSNRHLHYLSISQTARADSHALALFLVLSHTGEQSSTQPSAASRFQQPYNQSTTLTSAEAWRALTPGRARHAFCPPLRGSITALMPPGSGADGQRVEGTCTEDMPMCLVPWSSALTSAALPAASRL